MLELISFPVLLLVGFVVQLHTLIGPAGLALFVLGLWGWSRC